MTCRGGPRPLLLFLLFALCVAPWRAFARDDCDREFARSIPARAPEALVGSQFIARVRTMTEDARDRAIRRELLSGNLPPLLRHLHAVRMSDPAVRTGTPDVVICVTPDYVAVGSDHDHVLMPMGLPTALAIARQFGFLLPTRTMVDAIHRAATLRLRPQPLPATGEMRSIAWIDRHQQLIDAERLAHATPAHALIAGHKKDLVLTRLLKQVAGRVAVYGWHRTNGQPIQPLSTVHGARYADYSHGVRLVAATAYVDGEPRRLRSLLDDPRLGRFLHDEGADAGLGSMVEQLHPIPAAQILD